MALWPLGGSKERVSFLRSAQDTIGLLQYIGHESTSKGVESLGKLTRQPIQLSSSGVALVPLTALGAVLSRHHGAGAAAGMTFERDANGFGALLLGKNEALRLVDLLLGKPVGSTTKFGALEESAVAETANIALNAMVTAAAAASGSSIKTGVPDTTFKPKERLDALSLPSHGEDHAILLETAFAEETSGVGGTMLLVFFTRAAGGSE
jgi:chemotaxis protein CheC